MRQLGVNTPKMLNRSSPCNKSINYETIDITRDQHNNNSQFELVHEIPLKFLFGFRSTVDFVQANQDYNEQRNRRRHNFDRAILQNVRRNRTLLTKRMIGATSNHFSQGFK